MKKVVVDASVAAKWFVPEIHSAAADRLLDPSIVLCAPDLIVAEMGNIFWKKARRGEITDAEAREALRAFAAIPIEIRASSALLLPAFEIAAALDRSVYDSLYLALAIGEGCVMVTADARFHSVLA
ncbi:MAG TPA: type II toxin-antitoxin system VapC family toxin, partial [Thermoanaerobaculia bacterium]|nr:type II toxin-antitoxin system VapC family toxin [Thermoanaerobaculia bacterium]